ncbi:hypothetical protein [Tissierella creatinophila]|uniref:Uncharacterized protein n=1 Tax=Tissierella creatinophila DSM 6911 TaxID=1123403 RepID=A0A1U7M3X3_TISCR|nr:hypothetical protein [Tissierella creatinophila]OLS02017.1 hypothetical protein TICRE_20210 [Tissierella creatinophila DSM 6911]
MSGGSYNYLFGQVDNEYVGSMFDIELNDMMYDLVKVLKDLEWWQSGDIGEEEYRKTVKRFKDIWFGNREGINNRTVRGILKDAIKEIEDL